MIVFGPELDEWFELDKAVVPKAKLASACVDRYSFFGTGRVFYCHDKSAGVPW